MSDIEFVSVIIDMPVIIQQLTVSGALNWYSGQRCETRDGNILRRSRY
jgi:hypothetical protein